MGELLQLPPNRLAPPSSPFVALSEMELSRIQACRDPSNAMYIVPGVFTSPNRPPFTQSPKPPPPGVHYDNDGNPWTLDNNGAWVRLNPPFIPQLPSQRPPAQVNVAPAASHPANQVHQAQMQEYDFSMRPYSSAAASTSQAANNAFDLRLPPLPDTEDDDLSDPATIAHARGLQPAKKVAGARRKVKHPKGKARKRQRDSESEEDSDEPAAKRGRPSGSGNYSKDDNKALLDLVQQELPLGAKGWKVITGRFKKYYVKNGRPERGQKSLETKYKQWLKTKKPTGDASCPPEVKRAHQIEELINQRAGTRDLADSDFDTAVDDASSGEVEVIEHPSVCTAVARRVPTPPLRRNPRLNAPDVINQLSRAFDPDVQRQRDDERSQRSLQNTQLLAVNQQLRDAQATAEALRAQITIMQGRIHDVERARDPAELLLDMAEYKGGSVREKKDKKKIRCEKIYRDGGAATYWISGSSGSDSEKENKAPSSDPVASLSSRSRSPYPSSSPIQDDHHVLINDPVRPSFFGQGVELTISPRRGGGDP
ncbi:hypothetical protein C8J57DRAFT_1260794 [Mycena rebaudengoi]|nr:hypothetical protein C8J57DRAFT_1260794 [Mycena rebaudengoi]